MERVWDLAVIRNDTIHVRSGVVTPREELHKPHYSFSVPRNINSRHRILSFVKKFQYASNPHVGSIQLYNVIAIHASEYVEIHQFSYILV